MRRFLFCILTIPTLFIAAAFAQPDVPKSEKPTVADFEKRVKRYVERREHWRKTLPPMPEKATPEQIQAFKASLQKLVLADRVNARQGDLFTQQVSRLLKELIAKEFKGWERTELRKTVLEADTKGVPLKVNAIYPESKELVEMSPALLLALPQMPRELRYRFIGRSLAILDRDNGMILDFMKNALP